MIITGGRRRRRFTTRSTQTWPRLMRRPVSASGPSATVAGPSRLARAITGQR